MHARLALLISFACAAVACGSQSESTLAREDARALCLAEAPEALAATREVRGAQQRVQQRGDDAMTWVSAARGWVRIARQSADAGYYLNVDACLTAALQRDATLLPALELRTLVLLNHHRFEEARALSAAILERDNENVLAAGSLSDAALEQGDYAAAMDAAQRQMALRPDMAANMRGAWLRWLQGDGEGAKRMIRDALIDRDARDPEPAAWAFTEVAAIYWHAGDHVGAGRFYAEALRWLPEYPAALLGSARVALAQTDTRAAISALQRALQIAPSVEIAALLGDAHALAGDAIAAEKSYLAAEKLGRRGDALGLAAMLAARNRAPERALPLIEAERRSRGGVYVEDTYAWVLYRLGRFAEALAASDRARQYGTRDARLLYHAGAIRIALGDTDEGTALIADALALNPAFDPMAVPEARAILQTATSQSRHAREGGHPALLDAKEEAGSPPSRG